MNGWIKRIVATGLALGALFVGLLMVLSGMGHSRGVRLVVPRAPSIIASRIDGADHVDAYRITLAFGRFRNLDDVVAAAALNTLSDGVSETDHAASVAPFAADSPPTSTKEARA